MKLKKKPDLRSSGHLEKGKIGYRIEIQKNKNEVLLSDFELWHYVLNNWYLPESEEDSKAFDKRIQLQYPMTSDDDIKNFEKKVIEDSWGKIFDMSFEDPYIASPFDEKSIQATFWELSIEEVIKVDKFKSR